MITTERFPIDFDTIAPGDVLAAERIERAVQMTRNHPDFRLRMLGFRDHVVREISRRFRRTMVVVCEGCTLRVLTEAERVPYLWQQSEQARRRMAHAFKATVDTDEQQLDVDTKLARERNIEVMGKQLASMAKVRRQFIIGERRRDVPKMIDGKEPTDGT